MRCSSVRPRNYHHPDLFAQQGRHRDAFYFWSGWSGDDKRDCPTFICRPKVRTGDVMSGAGAGGRGRAAYIYILRFCRTRCNGPAQTKFPLQIRYIVEGNGKRMKLPEAYFPFRSPHFQNGFPYPLMFRKYRGFATEWVLPIN